MIMARVPKVVVVGSFMMDLVFRAPRRPSQGETLAGSSFGMFPGGKGANQAVAAARLGAQVSMIGCLGNDDFGKKFFELMNNEGINTSHIVVDESVGTGVSNPVVEDSGENSIIIVPQANLRLTVEHIRQSAKLIQEADVLLLQLESSLDASMEAARIAHDAGVKVVLNPAPYQELPKDFLEIVDVIVPNEVEFGGLTGSDSDDLDECIVLARDLMARGPKVVIITLGSRGALVVTAEQAKHVQGEAVSNVVDTTAAGDAFCGALAFGLASGNDPFDSVNYANKVAAVAITRLGAIPSLPRSNEV